MTREDLEIARKIIEMGKIEMIDTDLQSNNLILCRKIRKITVPINYNVPDEILQKILKEEKERLQNTIKYLMVGIDGKEDRRGI